MIHGDFQIDNFHSVNKYLKNFIDEDKNDRTLSSIKEIFSSIARFNQYVDHRVIKLHDISLNISLLTSMNETELYILNFYYLLRVIKKIKIMSQEKIRSELEQNLMRITFRKFLEIFEVAKNKFLKLDIKEFTVDDIRVLDVVKIRFLSLNQIRSLEEWHIQAFSNHQLEWLSICQFKALSPTQIKHMIPTQIHALSIEKINSLKREHIHSLSFEHIKVLDIQQVRALHIHLLKPEQLIILINFKFRYIHPLQFNSLTYEQINKLIGSNCFYLCDLLQHLTSIQLSNIQIKLFSPLMIYLFPVDQFKYLSPSQIQELNLEQIKMITVKKIQCLKLNQLQSFSTLQKTYFKNRESLAFKKSYIDKWQQKFIESFNLKDS